MYLSFEVADLCLLFVFIMYLVSKCSNGQKYRECRSMLVLLIKVLQAEYDEYDNKNSSNQNVLFVSVTGVKDVFELLQIFVIGYWDALVERLHVELFRLRDDLVGRYHLQSYPFHMTILKMICDFFV